MFDTDGNGVIDFNEFAGLWQYVCDWQDTFRSFDLDNSGTIDKNELKAGTYGCMLSACATYKSSSPYMLHSFQLLHMRTPLLNPQRFYARYNLLPSKGRHKWYFYRNDFKSLQNFNIIHCKKLSGVNLLKNIGKLTQKNASTV